MKSRIQNRRSQGRDGPEWSVARKPLYLLVLAALLSPGAVMAQEEEDQFALEEPAAPALTQAQIDDLTKVHSVVEIGIGYISEDSFRFGKFNGLDDEGIYGVLNLDYIRRQNYDSDSADYVRVQARNLGLDSRSLDAEIGRQGDYRVRVSYDEIPNNKSDSAKTIFRGAGGNNLTLPSDWVAATTTAGMTNLTSSLREVDLETERQRFGIGLEKFLPGHFSFSADYQYEEKDGLKSIGAVIGNTGGNPRAALIPEPVDYDTHTIDLHGRYTQNRLQVDLRYYLSVFEDRNKALVWQNPFRAIGGWVPSAGFPTGQGRLALPPDNTFHQGTAMVGYSLSDRSRIVADIAIGRMSQDDSFLPFTINPELAAAATVPLPRNSLDGRIDTTVANLRYTTRFGERLNLAASYRYDDRDNKTPRDLYAVIAGDSTFQDADEDSERLRFNQPYSYEENKFRLDLNYRLAARTQLTALGEYRDINRTFSERDSTEEWSYGAGVIHNLSDTLDANLRLTRSERDGTQYLGSRTFDLGFTPEHVATVPGGFENPPALRRFTIADRDRDQGSLLVTWTPSQYWSLGLDVSYSRDDFEDSDLGLTYSRLRSYTLDFNANPAKAWNTYAFFTHEEYDWDQNGVSFRSGANRVNQILDPGQAWRAVHNDKIDSAGLGALWKAPGGRFEVGLDYIASLSRSDVDVTTGANLTSAPLPLNRVRLNSGTLHASYALREDLSLKATVWQERYRTDDIALDGVEANQLANVILFGEESPDYDVTAVSLSVIYKF